MEITLKLKSTENRRIINGGEMSRKIRQDHTRRETFPGRVNQFNVKKIRKENNKKMNLEKVTRSSN